jgi:hypothetical protein
VAFLAEPQTLADRLGAKQRTLGVNRAQAATWHLSPDRRKALETFLNAEDAVLAGLLSLKRRR